MVNESQNPMTGIKRIVELAFVLAKTDFKVRNEGSYLGMLWYLINPLLMFAVLWVIFSQKLGQGIPLYPAYLLLGIITFNIFQQATHESAGVLMAHGGLLKSSRFPYQSLVLSIIFRSLMSHVFEIGILAVALSVLGVPIWGLILYPLVLLFYVLFIYGISLMLAILTVYVIDLANIWRFFSFLLWLATPIFYAAGNSSVAWVNSINPLYYFLSIFRDTVIYGRIPEFATIVTAIIFALGFLFVGVFMFSKLEFKITEKV